MSEERKNSYAAWIKEYVSSLNGNVYAMCQEATAQMSKAFPELIRVPGYAYGSEHWWMKTADGEIVDPTISQFGVNVPDPSRYVEWNPRHLVRVGRCMECGNDIYRRVETLGVERLSICSKVCERRFQKDAEERHRRLKGTLKQA